jgi:hypothetical protein
LVKKVEIDIEPVWREMRNMPWAKMENVGDSSGYTTELLRVIRERVADILKMLHKQQYARAFCDNFVDAMSMLYIQNVAICKPVSEGGAEQMLLDAYTIKKGLVDLPVINEAEGTQAPAT